MLRITFFSACLAVVFAAPMLALGPDPLFRTSDRAQQFYFETRSGSVRVVTPGLDGASGIIESQLAQTERNRVSMADTRASLELVRAGQVNAAFVLEGLVNPGDGVMAAARLDPLYVHTVTLADAPLDGLGVLAGKRVFVGPETGDGYAVASRTLALDRLVPPPELVHGPFESAQPALDQGRADAVIIVSELNGPFIQNLMRTGAYALVPIPESGAVSHGVRGVRAATIPGGMYGPNFTIPPRGAEPFPALALDRIVAVQHGAPAGPVRSLLDDLRSAGALAIDSDPVQSGAHIAELPIHPAAARYLAPDAQAVDVRFASAVAILAALLLGAAAVQSAVVRRARANTAARRRGIVPYFDAMATFGNAVENSQDAGQLLSILHSMMANHRRAEEDWLNGELDTADMAHLYAVFAVRNRNAHHKLLRLRLAELQDDQHALRTLILEALGKPAPAQARKSSTAAESPRARHASAPEPRKDSAKTDEALPEIVIPPDKAGAS